MSLLKVWKFKMQTRRNRVGRNPQEQVAALEISEKR
jgi:nucleoid DNA-binding protein